MRINPVYLKDLKSNVNNVRFASFLFLYNLCLGLIVILALYSGMHKQSGQIVFNYNNCIQIFTLISCIEFMIIFLIVPILTSGAIAGEREKMTLDLLLTSRLNTFNIICGKMAYSITSVIFILISSFPVVAMVSNTGAIGIKEEWQIFLLIIVTAIYVASISIFFSTIMKKTISATIWTYGFLLIMTIGTLLIYNLNYYVLQDIQVVQSVAESTKKQAYLFLLNPMATFVYIISQTNQEQYQYIKWFPEVVETHWVELSIFSQIVFALILILLSSIKLNPLSENLFRKTNKKRNKKRKTS